MLHKPLVSHNAEGRRAYDVHDPGKRFVSDNVTVNPQATMRIGLGLYGVTQPSPEFDLTVEPDIQDALAATLERMDIPGESKYMLIYHLSNYGDKPCRVTVTLRQASPAS
ncbi:MAG TPA: hypothetical protein VHT70_05350 [Candidatus Saccharimonadales bacterium]|jgi:hypothetical protein|nr:hypothetical protein [Candidatus Saccharimonadales bacterium]